jgi:hypothetical protein
MCAVNYPTKLQGDAKRVGFRLPLVRTLGWCQIAPGGVDARVQVGVIEEPTEPLLGSMILLVRRQVKRPLRGTCGSTALQIVSQARAVMGVRRADHEPPAVLVPLVSQLG